MDVHKSIFRKPGIFLAVLASTISPGLLHAAGLSLSSTTATTITCNTATTGPATPVTITVKPGTDTTYPTLVTPGALPAGLVVTPASQTLTSGNAATGLPFVFAAAPGCSGLSAGANTASTFVFMVSQNSAAAVADTNAVTTTITVTAAAAGMSATVPAVTTISCLYNGSTYTPTPSTLSVPVTSTTTGGTPFTVSKPTFLSVSPAGPYNATASVTTLTFTPVCSGPVGTINSGAITLNDSPAPGITIPVTLKVVTAAVLTTTTPPAQTYTKGSGSNSYPSWTVTLGGATTGQIFTVNPATLGSWLTASPLSGAYGTSNTIVFQATGGIDSLAPQATPYTQIVHIQVSGYVDTTVAISVVVSNPAATLSFAEGSVRNLTWVQSQGIPTATITAVSSGSPIQYTTTSSGVIAPIIAAAETSGFAYNFGTEIPVTFPNLPFSEAQAGSVLTGAVTFKWGTNTSTVTFHITVQAGTSTAVIGAATPSNLPTASVGEQFTLTLYGSGFVPLSDPTQRTTVGIVNASNQIVQDANIISSTVVNSSTITLTIQAPAVSSDPLLPFTGTSVIFGVCNPSGGTCLTPTGSVSVPVGAGPTISSIVSASTLASVSPAIVAPYDILTLFGSNFCTSVGTGCSAGAVLYGTLNPATLTYTTSLSPDGGQRTLAVKFGLHGAAASTFVAAPLLFATNNQINVVVPATGFPAAASAVDVVVSFGGLTSNTFSMTSTATDPGIFTIDTFGQAAILNPNYSAADGGNPASMGGIVQIYATGLGTPTSLTVSTPVTYNSATCITPANYETAAGNGASVDGALIQSALLGANLPPCFGTGAPSSIKVGGQAATIGYTGWVADSVAGLYQSNATLPAATSPGAPGYFVDAAGTHLTAITNPVQLPIVITSNTLLSQQPGTNLGLTPGATLWVKAPPLTVTTPGTLTVTTEGGAWTPTMTASGGTGPYTFKVDGLASPATGGLVYTVATPTLTFVTAPTTTGVYIITVTATDSIGNTGSNTFTLTVTDSTDTSTVTAAATPIVPSVFGTANPAVTTITAGGGTGPYTYAISPSAVFSISTTGVVSAVSYAQAGVYHPTVTVTDSLAATRTITFDAPIAMPMTTTNGLNTQTGIANLSISQVLTTIGNQGGGTVTYALLTQPDAAKCTMTLASGVITVPSSCVAGTYSVSIVGTDSAPTNGATGAVATLNLSVHLD